MTIRTFTVVTPCLDAETLIQPTLESILRQTAVRSGRVELQLLVCDGGSRDRTLDVVRGVCGDRAEIVPGPDAGMYDGIAAGLRRCRGDVVSYLNAGDVYDAGAFDTVADVFEAHGVRWLTGMRVARNDRLQVIEALLPFRYRRPLITRGAYGKVMPFIQQESTFWARTLLSSVDLETLRHLRYAGDFYLWRCFAAVADLVVVEAQLGGFTYHPGQRSENLAAYRDEFRRLALPLGPVCRLLAEVDKRLWAAPAPLKKRLSGSALLRYDLSTRRWS